MAVKTYDLEGVGNDADSEELLSAVTAVHHERVGQTLDDGALSLAETLGSIAASGVRDVDRRADLDVVARTIRVSKKFSSYQSSHSAAFDNLFPVVLARVCNVIVSIR